MKSVKILSILIVASIALGGALILLTNDAEADNQLNVCVTLPWQKEMVNWIAGDIIAVTQFIGPGADPHGGEHGTVNDLVAASKSIAYFYIGAQMEWEVTNVPVIRQNFPNMAIINSSTGLTLLSVTGEGHGNEEDGHGPIDGHVWTLPSNLLVIANNVKNTLINLDPDHEIFYESGYIQYVNRVNHIKHLADEKFSDSVGKKFLVWHSAWKYLSEGYGLNEISLENQISAGMTAQDILSMVTIARDEGLDVIFVRPQDPISSDGIKNSLLQKSITIIDVNPLSIEYLDELESFISHLADSWEAGAS